MTIQHSTITGADLHEPKGVATAANNTVYVANGSASGAWTPLSRYLGVYTGFDSTTPAYSHSTTTSDTVLNNTFNASENNGFTILTSPNTRIRYDGTETISANVLISLSTEQASGSNKEVEWALYKNGSAIVGSRSLRTLSTSNWGSITLNGFTELSTNDYLEIFTKADGATTVLYASIQLSIVGTKK